MCISKSPSEPTGDTGADTAGDFGLDGDAGADFPFLAGNKEWGACTLGDAIQAIEFGDAGPGTRMLSSVDLLWDIFGDENLGDASQAEL